MLETFHHAYPTGSLISELVQTYQGKYVVRVSIQVNNNTLTTGLASAETIEEAEDRARYRALEVLNLTNISQHIESEKQEIKEELILETPAIEVNFPSEPEVTIEVAEPTPVESPGETSSKSKKKTETKTIAKAEIPKLELSEVVKEDVPSIPVTPTPIPTTVETAELFPEPPLEAFPETLSEELPLEDFIYEPQFEQPVEDLGIISELPITETPLPAIASTNVMPFTPRNYTPIEEDTPETLPVAATSSKKKKKSETIDQSDDIAKISVEMQRLGWTTDQGREYLINTYNKRSRHLLSTEEIEDFLRYLESQPTPVDHLPLEPTF